MLILDKRKAVEQVVALAARVERFAGAAIRRTRPAPAGGPPPAGRPARRNERNRS